jgi:hypothetical protein
MSFNERLTVLSSVPPIKFLFVYHAATLQANADRQQQKTLPSCPTQNEGKKIIKKRSKLLYKSNENIDNKKKFEIHFYRWDARCVCEMCIMMMMKIILHNKLLLNYASNYN